MAYDIKNLSLGTLIASSSFQNRQYYAVQASTVENYFGVGGTTGNSSPVGILQNNPLTGEAGEIWIAGCVSKLVCQTALSPGDRFWIADNGKAYSTGAIPIKTTMYGPVLTAGASSGGIATVVFNCFGITT